MVCVISQFQEYLEGRGTAAFDYSDRLATVQYTATGPHTTTTSSLASGRRRSAAKPMPSRHDPEEFSEAPSKAISKRLHHNIHILQNVPAPTQQLGFTVSDHTLLFKRITSACDQFIMDGARIGSANARTLTTTQRAVLSASVACAQRTPQDVCRRSTARRRVTTEGR
ncbi:unnamed protein product [Diatraea saccharalis]|uniref:Uncharacterized protein n=1 Tax=Diatraea saccharalis TaxID=40085 RepID=A0A9N9N3U9_9NEOP|nr:unnamed protein product [Diatraea saccharalis]